MNPISILSAMITPVVLIMACGSLILTTSQRLSRVIERSRKLTDDLKLLAKSFTDPTTIDEEEEILFAQLKRNTLRASLLQRAIAGLYITLSVFVATSIAIAVIDIANAKYTWIPIVLGVSGTAILFYASILLIKESRMAVTILSKEMDEAISFIQQKRPSLAKRFS